MTATNTKEIEEVCLSLDTKKIRAPRGPGSTRAAITQNSTAKRPDQDTPKQ